MDSRIEIRYEIEEAGSIKKKSLPFCVGIIGNLCGNASDYLNTPVTERDFIEVTHDNINNILSQLKPQTRYEVDNVISKTGPLQIDITFENIDDFKPEHIIESVPELKKLYQLRNKIKQLQVQSEYDRYAVAELRELLETYRQDKERKHD